MMAAIQICLVKKKKGPQEKKKVLFENDLEFYWKTKLSIHGDND